MTPTQRVRYERAKRLLFKWDDKMRKAQNKVTKYWKLVHYYERQRD